MRHRQNRRDQRSTPAFKRWFGNSKVVDGYGEPMSVFHGSAAGDIESFIIPSDKPRRMRAFFFSDSDTVAEEYGEYVYPVYLRMENPLRVNAGGADWSEIPKKAVNMRGWSASDKERARELMDPDNTGVTTTDRVAAVAQTQGFDGAIISDVIDSATGLSEERTTVYIVFDPRQIKSATENAGTFDPDETSIYRNPRARRA